MKIQDDAGAWVDEEFETLDLGDPRRDRRAKELVKRFASRPTPKMPAAGNIIRHSSKFAIELVLYLV